MPDITLKYKKEEIEDFIRQMLAVRGLCPKDSIEFCPMTGEDGIITYEFVIECVSGPLLSKCPVCQNTLPDASCGSVTTHLTDNKPITTFQTDEKPTTTFYTDTTDRGAYKDPYGTKYTLDTFDEQMPLDAELGEAYDPPTPSEAIPSETRKDGDSDTRSIRSLLAANKQLTKQRERELAQQRKESGHLSLMAGESTKPPTPGPSPKGKR
ncbi:MAG: hypothetical protein PVI90_00900 [Desulfobacteraceae bacterium]|jgi:hypothetical protein